jgi:hypothetical protein
MLYDADLIPDPVNAEIITFKLNFYNYGSTAETIDLGLNWHANLLMNAKKLSVEKGV